VTWNGERFTLVDTGGVSIPDVRQATDAIAAGTRLQVDSALQDAAVAILVTDVQSGLHPMDEAVARIVRKSGVPCFVAVNKADGDNVAPARIAAAEYASALHVMARRDADWTVPVLTCSAATGEGVQAIWEAVSRRMAALRADGRLHERRRQQNLRWMQSLIDHSLRGLLDASAPARAELARATADVLAGAATPARAAARVIGALTGAAPR
jgi:small GTP-binding protein